MGVNIEQLMILIETNTSQVDTKLASVNTSLDTVTKTATGTILTLDKLSLSFKALSDTMLAAIRPLALFGDELLATDKVATNAVTRMDKLALSFTNVERAAVPAGYALLNARGEMTGMDGAAKSANTRLSAMATRLYRLATAAATAGGALGGVGAGMSSVSGAALPPSVRAASSGARKGPSLATELKRTGGELTNMGMLSSMFVSAPLVGAAAVSFPKGASADTAAMMDALSKKAIELGADLSLPATSAAQAADAMLQMKERGISLQDTMDGAKAVLQLSAAASISNADAATVVASSLHAFGLQGKDLQGVVNVLAGAMVSSGASAQEMSNAVEMGGSVAHKAGMSVRDFSAAVGEMVQQGLSGEVAGTTLKMMFQRLEAPTKATTDLLNKYGIALYDAQGKMLPFRDLISQFTEKFGDAAIASGKMTEEQRNAAGAAIFGTRAVQGFNDVLTHGTDNFDKMTGSIDSFGNAAKNLADSRMKGLTGGMEQLKSQFETVSLTTTTQFMPAIEGLLGGVTQLVTGFGELDNNTKVAFVTIGAALALGGPVMGGMGLLASAAGALLAPEGLLVAGAAAAALAIAGIGAHALISAAQLKTMGQAATGFSSGTYYNVATGHNVTYSNGQVVSAPNPYAGSHDTQWGGHNHTLDRYGNELPAPWNMPKGANSQQLIDPNFPGNVTTWDGKHWVTKNTSGQTMAAGYPGSYNAKSQQYTTLADMPKHDVDTYVHYFDVKGNSILQTVGPDGKIVRTVTLSYVDDPKHPKPTVDSLLTGDVGPTPKTGAGADTGPRADAWTAITNKVTDWWKHAQEQSKQEAASQDALIASQAVKAEMGGKTIAAAQAHGWVTEWDKQKGFLVTHMTDSMGRVLDDSTGKVQTATQIWLGHIYGPTGPLSSVMDENGKVIGTTFAGSVATGMEDGDTLKRVRLAGETINRSARESFKSKDRYWYDMGKDIPDTMASGMDDSEAMKKVRGAAETLATQARNAAMKKDAYWYDLGKSIPDGVASGMEDAQAMKRIRDAASAMAKAAWEGANKHIQASSPSKVFMKLGATIPQGLGLGIRNDMDHVHSAVNAMGLALLRTGSAMGVGNNKSGAYSNSTSTINSNNSNQSLVVHNHYYGSTKPEQTTPQYANNMLSGRHL